MPTPLTISEQEKRLLNGHKALLSAIGKYVKAKNDLKDYPYSQNIKTAYNKAYNNLKDIAKHETDFFNQIQNELF